MRPNAGEEFTFPLITRVHQDAVIKLDVYLGSSVASTELKVAYGQLDSQNGTESC